MDNAQKAIMIGVGLFITIIIISAVLLIVNLGTGLVDDATSELGSMSTTLQNSILQTYDGKIVSGTQVKAAINQYYSDPDVSLAVYDKEGDIAVQVGAKIMTLNDAADVLDNIRDNTVFVENATALTDFSDDANGTSRTQRGAISQTNNDAYINTSKNFNAAVVRNEANDTIVGIVFCPAAN